LDPRVQTLSSDELAKLLKWDPAGEPLWGPSELAEVLRHQLEIPLELGINQIGASDLTRLEMLRNSVTPPIATLRDLLTHPNPPLSLLESAKNFAKLCLDQPNKHLPPDVATALYYACIASALLCYRKKITSLSDAELCSGLEWLEAQDWTGDNLCAAARKARLSL
jgi:hypothetical protein